MRTRRELLKPLLGARQRIPRKHTDTRTTEDLEGMLRALRGNWQCGAAVLNFTEDHPEIAVTPLRGRPYSRPVRVISRGTKGWLCQVGEVKVSFALVDTGLRVHVLGGKEWLAIPTEQDD